MHDERVVGPCFASFLQSVIAIIEQQLMHHCACQFAASSTNLCLLACGLPQVLHRMLLHFGPFCCRRPFNVGTRRCLLLQNCRFILSAQFPHIPLQSSSHKKWIMDPISGDYFKSCTLSRLVPDRVQRGKNLG